MSHTHNIKIDLRLARRNQEDMTWTTEHIRDAYCAGGVGVWPVSVVGRQPAVIETGTKVQVVRTRSQPCHAAPHMRASYHH
jgi:hypothetical protein